MSIGFFESFFVQCDVPGCHLKGPPQPSAALAEQRAEEVMGFRFIATTRQHICRDCQGTRQGHTFAQQFDVA